MVAVGFRVDWVREEAGRPVRRLPLSSRSEVKAGRRSVGSFNSYWPLDTFSKQSQHNFQAGGYESERKRHEEWFQGFRFCSRMDWSHCLSRWRQVEKVWSERREVSFRHAEYQSCSLGILVDISSGLWVCSLWGEGWAGGIHMVVMIYRQGCQATALNEPKKSRAWVLACVHQGKGEKEARKRDQEEATGRGGRRCRDGFREEGDELLHIMWI